MNQLEEFDRSYAHFSLLSNLQVQGETIYANRTNVITLTHGFLLVGFQAFGSDSRTDLLGRAVIALFGLSLSIAWLAFEQRNQIYFVGRGKFLIDAERDMLTRAQALNIPLAGFWAEVPRWVKQHAKWYQRFSAPRILRGLVPIMFSVMWLVVAGFTVGHLVTMKEQTPTILVCDLQLLSAKVRCVTEP